ncbi:T9SS type A sorting domain-containing protein [Crocinitomix catalasitica]|nr:T9SS type A sorting domain-containing protein [Crocinitomix catalasitica]
MKNHLLRYSTLVAAFLCWHFSLAQNLVPNPSFEDSIMCPSGQDQIYNTESWYSPTWGTPDYFDECGTGNGAVPQNAFGWQYARTGEAYAGGHVSNFTGTNVREYIQAQLISPLETNSHYEVSFWVTHADSSQRACDNIGAYLSSTAISSSDAVNLPYTPQVVSEEGAPITDQLDWVRIVDTIVASGGENYITIGVFTDDASTNWIFVGGGWEAVAHYYFDDVSVIKVGTAGTDNTVSEIGIQVSYLSENLISIRSIQPISNVQLLSASGKLVYTVVNPDEDKLLVDMSLFPKGTYFLHVHTASESKKQLIINP